MASRSKKHEDFSTNELTITIVDFAVLIASAQSQTQAICLSISHLKVTRWWVRVQRIMLLQFPD